MDTGLMDDHRFVHETAGTAFFVPHGALGVELTPNYHERTRLFGYI